jgi:hypothetical protein
MSTPRPRVTEDRPARERGSSALLAAVVLVSLCSCGSSVATRTKASPTSTPAFVSEPLTPQQQRVEQGAHLIVAYGCAACHLANANQNLGPNFDQFAGHDVELADGQHVLVDERFLRDALLDPHTSPIKGDDPAPMRRAVEHLQLNRRPEQVAALIAFIEQIGPEPG